LDFCLNLTSQFFPQKMNFWELLEHRAGFHTFDDKQFQDFPGRVGTLTDFLKLVALHVAANGEKITNMSYPTRI